jgi:hypothetical protein
LPGVADLLEEAPHLFASAQAAGVTAGGSTPNDRREGFSVGVQVLDRVVEVASVKRLPATEDRFDMSGVAAVLRDRQRAVRVRCDGNGCRCMASEDRALLSGESRVCPSGEWPNTFGLAESTPVECLVAISASYDSRRSLRFRHLCGNAPIGPPGSALGARSLEDGFAYGAEG